MPTICQNRLFAVVRFLVSLTVAALVLSFLSLSWFSVPNSNTHPLMKYVVLALAVTLVTVSCRTQQPAPTPPPMVDMGYRSGK